MQVHCRTLSLKSSRGRDVESETFEQLLPTLHNGSRDEKFHWKLSWWESFNLNKVCRQSELINWNFVRKLSIEKVQKNAMWAVLLHSSCVYDCDIYIWQSGKLSNTHTQNCCVVIRTWSRMYTERSTTPPLVRLNDLLFHTQAAITWWWILKLFSPLSRRCSCALWQVINT